MKIGFNLDAISKNKSFKLIKDPKEYSKLMKEIKLSEKLKEGINSLKDKNHDIYIFSPTSIELDEKTKLKIKKRIIKKFIDEGINISRFAIVKEEELVNVAKRNHIDIAIDNNEERVEKINNFSDAINMTDENILLDEIFENIEKNREAIMDCNTQPSGLPSEDQLWLKNYRVGDYKWSKENMSPYERLKTSNLDFFDETAMEFFGKKFSYGKFITMIDELCNKMAASGIKKGMRVPVVVVNAPESFITLYALYKIKATIVPIFPLSTKEDFKEKLHDIDIQNKEDGINENYMFVSDLVYGRVKDSVPENTKTVILPITNSMPKPLSVAFNHIVMPKLGVKPVQYNEKVVSFNDFSNILSDNNLEIDSSFDNDFTAVQLFTGGTIKSKGVKLTQGNLDSAAKQFYNDRFDFKRGDKIAAFMPLNHSFGLIIGTHVAATLGVNLDIIMKINFKRLDKLFLKDKVNIFGGIPNMFPAIRNNKKLQKAKDLSHVKYVLSGGAKIDSTEKNKSTNFLKERKSNAETRDGYGLTETASGIIYDGVLNMYATAKIVAINTTNELGYNQIGELCLSGPQIMAGYTDEQLSEQKLKKHADNKTWFHTGDTAIIREDGLIEIIGRLDRMIKVNGEQVLLDKVEEVINTVPFVEKSAVVKKDDPKKGNVPVAFVQLKQGYNWNSDTEAALNSFYEQNLSHFSRPKKTMNVLEFPVTKVGKIDFKELEKIANTQEEVVKTI